MPVTAPELLAALAAGETLPGRHLVIAAHPDDESISLGGALCLMRDVVVVGLTDGVHEDDPEREDRAEAREAERAAAALAAAWPIAYVRSRLWARGMVGHLDLVDDLVTLALYDYRPDVVWTHPYEGGHVDHDIAAWAVQRGCHFRPEAAPPVLRMEFASYHATPGGQAFGRFWHDPARPAVRVALAGARLARKLAAVRAYTSQAGILRKFKEPENEHYRQAPEYDFTRPAPPPTSRWDAKGYRPPLADMRAAFAAQEQR